MVINRNDQTEVDYNLVVAKLGGSFEEGGSLDLAIEVLSEVLAKNQDVINFHEPIHHESLLHKCAQLDLPEAAEILLDHGADSRLLSANKTTALWEAEHFGSQGAAEILKRRGATSKCDIPRDRSNIHSAAFVHFMTPGLPVNRTYLDDYILACRIRKARVAIHILKTWKPKAEDRKDSSPYNSGLMNYAASYGLREVVQYLHSIGDRYDHRGRPARSGAPIVKAALSGHYEMVEFFLSQGVDLEAEYDVAESYGGQVIDDVCRLLVHQEDTLQNRRGRWNSEELEKVREKNLRLTQIIQRYYPNLLQRKEQVERALDEELINYVECAEWGIRDYIRSLWTLKAKREANRRKKKYL